MRCIIAGSRSITDSKIVESVLEQSSWKIEEVVSGHAKGVDVLGEEWAKLHNIPIKLFPAKWDDLDVSGVVIKVNSKGKKYNAVAGFRRNREMGEYADALIAIWDGKSKGTPHRIRIMELLGKPRFIYNTKSQIYVLETWKVTDKNEEGSLGALLH